MPLSPSSSRPVFDILRGWPRGGAVEDVFTPTGSVELEEGDLIEVLSTGLVNKVTLASGDTKLVYIVVEGNKSSDSYSGNYLGKVVAITGDYKVITTKYASGSYLPGLPVTVIGGKFSLLVKGEPIVGFVNAYDSVAGTLTVTVVN